MKSVSEAYCIFIFLELRKALEMRALQIDKAELLIEKTAGPRSKSKRRYRIHKTDLDPILQRQKTVSVKIIPIFFS